MMEFASDSSVLVSHDQPLRLFQALLPEAQLLGLTNLKLGFGSVLVEFDPFFTNPQELMNKLEMFRKKASRLRDATAPKTVHVPVKYGGEEGPDLTEVCEQTGLQAQDVLKLHQEQEYKVAFLGFTPGFAYLSGLDHALRVTRKAVPRLNVKKGSVGLATSQTGIYPEDSPGGWQVIGKTNLELFNPHRYPPALFGPGDLVRFMAVDVLSPSTILTQKVEPSVNPVLEIISGGFQSTVQDLGRFGFAHLGVPTAGAADPLAVKLGNGILGNQCGAAAIEVLLGGVAIRFLKDTWVCLTGAPAKIDLDGNEIPMWRSHPTVRGQILNIARTQKQLRVYLCIRNGIKAPRVLGSRSTYTTGEWGGYYGKNLSAGDQLELSDDVQAELSPRSAALIPRELYAAPIHELRVTQGPQWDWFSPETQKNLLVQEFEVTTECSRMGLRLSGKSMELNDNHKKLELESEGVAAGAVQVASSGQPMILFCEAGTTGGYPKIANVIRADLFKLGQISPGTKFKFKDVSFEQAWRINQEFELTLQNAGYAL